MSLYHFAEPSVIHEINMRKSAGGGMRTFLFASDNITPQQIKEIKEALSQSGWHCVANEYKGKMCLEVRGVSKIDPLEAVLREKKFIEGKYTRISSEEDDKFSLLEKFKENMLWVYGIMNVIADAGITAYGVIRRRLPGQGKDHWEEEAGAIAYGLGSLTFLGFGRGDKSDHHLVDISTKLHEEMKSRGLETQDSSVEHLSSTLSKLGVIDKSQQFLHKNPAEIGNFFYGSGWSFLCESWV